MRRVFGILVMVAVLAVSSGCGQIIQKATEKAVEQTTGVKVDEKSDSVTITGNSGDGVTFGSKLPDELKNFQVPSGFQNKDGASMTTGGDKLLTGTWTGKSTVDKVFDFYKNNKPSGWTESMSFSSGDSAQYQYTKDPNQSLIITLTTKDTDVEISVLLSIDSMKTPMAQNTPASQATRTSGTSITPVSGSASTPTSSKPQASPTPAGPELVDASSLPQELKALPMPSGFGVIKGSTSRSTSGGQFSYASAALFGKTAVKDVADFYQNNLSKSDWEEDISDIGEDEADLLYTNVKDSDLILQVLITKIDAGTEVEIQLYK